MEVGVIKAPVYWSKTWGANGSEASLVSTGLLIVLDFKWCQTFLKAQIHHFY
jgi:hypothetical protein